MATPPPTPPSPPSPPKGDGTPDRGNPAHTAPPAVEPKPGRAGAATPSRGGRRKAGSGDSATPKLKRTTKAKSSKTTGAPAKAPTASRTPAAPRKSGRPAAPRAAGRPRVRSGPSIATAPTTQPTDVSATDPATRGKGHWWWKTIAGGLGAIAAGAALFSLKGSSRRRTAHQADGTDSSKSFDAGIADEGTIPDKPAEG
jgi:hypothetical protein